MYLQHVIEDVERELLQKGFTLQFSEGDFVYQNGNTPEGIYYLEDGVVVNVDAKDGARKLIPNHQIFGLKEILLSEQYKDSAMVLSKAKVIMLPKKGLMKLLGGSIATRALLVKTIFSKVSSKDRIAYE